MAAACHFLLPWDACHYPGLGRGLRQLVQNRVRPETALKWRKRNPAPLWAMRLLLDRVRSNIQLGLRVEDALARAIAEKEALPYKPRGLEIIDDATGLPKYRNRVGKRKVDREV